MHYFFRTDFWFNQDGHPYVYLYLDLVTVVFCYFFQSLEGGILSQNPFLAIFPCRVETIYSESIFCHNLEWIAVPGVQLRRLDIACSKFQHENYRYSYGARKTKTTRILVRAVDQRDPMHSRDSLRCQRNSKFNISISPYHVLSIKKVPIVVSCAEYSQSDRSGDSVELRFWANLLRISRIRKPALKRANNFVLVAMLK